MRLLQQFLRHRLVDLRCGQGEGRADLEGGRVLDEVDGRMDDDGIDALVSIIKGELASKVETVLVISHRDMMFDTFDKEIKVVRKDRFSYLDAV